MVKIFELLIMKNESIFPETVQNEKVAINITVRNTKNYEHLNKNVL